MPLLSLPRLHLAALRWFEDRSGQAVTYDELTNDRTPCLLTTRAKGIYKPKGADYALSIRQGLNSKYSDKEPVYQQDGSWTYLYAQEESATKPAEQLSGNRSLQKCMLDDVPIAVLHQLSPKPHVSYRVMGLAYVTDWKDGFFTLKSTTLPLTDEPDEEDVSRETPPPLAEFDPARIADERKKALRSIAVRQGQSAFRSGLLLAYQGKCAISGCSIKAVLEAAHITPFRGPNTNAIDNGLLLRSDLHTLWDQGLLHLDEELRVQLHPSLKDSEYQVLANRPLAPTLSPSSAPSLKAILAHREWCLNKDR